LTEQNRKFIINFTVHKLLPHSLGFVTKKWISKATYQ